MSSELVLVEASVLQGELHLVQLLGGLLSLHLQPLLSAGHVGHTSVETFDLDIILVDSNLELLNNL